MQEKMKEKQDVENLQFERRRAPILRDLIAIVLLSELFGEGEEDFPMVDHVPVISVVLITM